MSEYTSVSDRRFDFARVIARTFGLTARNFPLYGLMALLFVGAPQFGMLYLQSTLWLANPGSSVPVGWASGLVSLVSTVVLQGALTRAAMDSLTGRRAGIGAATADGVRFLLPLFLIGVLSGIGVLLGLLLLVVPGIFVAVRWAVAAPIAVVEREGPTAALGRSAELTEGHRWAIFGLFLLFLVLAYVVEIVISVAFLAIGGANAGYLAAQGALGLAYAATSAVVGALTSLLSAVGTTSLYFELRHVKDGVGVSDLAAVFD